MPSHCRCLLRLTDVAIDTGTARRIASLALRSSLSAMTSALRLGRCDWRGWRIPIGTPRSLHDDPFGSPVRYASPCRSRWLIDRAVSLASRPRLRVSRSLRIDRRGSTGVTLAASARLAGGRGDAVASPALPLRIAPCRCHRAGADRHGSLASRRSLRIAGSLRIAVAIALAYRPRPSRSHRGHASACRARYASTGAVRPKPGSLAVPQCLRIASTSYASLGHPVLRTDPVAG